MSVNQAIIVGRLGRDPESRTTTSGMTIVELRVATDRWKKGEGKVTDWHSVKVFDKQAEACARHLSKGSEVAVVGRMETSSWEDRQTGAKRYKTEVIADRVSFIGGRGERSGSTSSAGYGSPPPQQAPAEDFASDEDLPF